MPIATHHENSERREHVRTGDGKLDTDSHVTGLKTLFKSTAISILIVSFNYLAFALG